MKNLNILFLIIFFSIIQIHSQNFTFGKVSKAELEEKYHPKDSSANAAILYRSENVGFNFSDSNGFRQVKDITMRIKIYNKEGLDWANKKVYLYKSTTGNNEKIKNIKGCTFNFNNGKIDKTKLKSGGVFLEEATDIFNISSFTLPNVSAGSVIEYQYTVSSPFLQVDDINLQYSIPVNKLDVTVATPQFYKYKRLFNPRASFSPNIAESIKVRTASYSSRGASALGTSSSGFQVGSGSSRVNNQFEYNDNIITISEINIPSLKAESFGGNINNYKAKLSLELEARLAREGYVEKSYAASWEGVSKSIYESESFGGQLKKASFFSEDLSQVIKGDEDNFQKAFLVENFVKSKVKWNRNYGVYAQKGIRAAYRDGEGNVADINLLVVAMLKSLGLKANPVLISTRNNGVPLFPTRDGFNYVICMLETERGSLLIDATEPYSFGNVLPERVLNWKGRVIKEGGVSDWVSVTSGKKSKKSTMLNVTVDEDFLVTGKVRVNYTSNLALKYRQRYTNLSLDDHIKALESDKGALEISELNYENDKNLSQPVKVSYNYELSDGVDEVADKLYFSPLLFLAISENPFKLEERLYPIDFVYSFQDMSLVNILIPEGYTVESLPESTAMEFRDGNVKFSYILKENGKYLSLKVNFEIANPIIAATDYKSFKEFYTKIIEKHTEQIVLKKI